MSDIKKPSPAASDERGFDAEFDAFLREEDSRLAALYRKLPHPEPDAALDVRVRAQAQRALNEGVEATAQTGTQRARGWLPAFGAAATLVLVAGLAWRLMPPNSPTHEAATVADTAATTAVQGERAAPPPAPVTPPAQPAAAPIPMDADAQYQRREQRAVAAKPESSAAANNTGAAAKSAANGTLAAAPKVAAPAPATPPASAEPRAFPPQVVEQQRAKSAPPAIAAPAPPPPPPAAMEAETARPASTAAAAPSPELRKAASSDRAAAADAFVDRAAAGGSSFVVTPDPSSPARYRWESADGTRGGFYPPDPPPLAAWVEIVRAMLRDGRRDAARQALADLRAHHPDFRAPADLRGLE